MEVLDRNDADVKMAESRLFSISTPRSYMPKIVDVKQKMTFFFWSLQTVGKGVYFAGRRPLREWQII
jgi:hypothetical protein